MSISAAIPASTGTKVEGPSLYDVVATKDPALADALKADIDDTMTKLGAIVASGRGRHRL